MYPFISVRASKQYRKPIVRFHRTAVMAALTAKAHGGLWKELSKKEVKKNIASGEDCVVCI
jgi:hypothetical protein